MSKSEAGAPGAANRPPPSGAVDSPVAAPPVLLCVLLTATTLIGFTANAMVAPLLIDLATAFDVTVAVAGQLATATSLLWALGSPIGGQLVDRFGRRPLLIGGLLLSTFATGLAAIAPTFGFLFAARLLSGVAGTFIGPSVLTTAGEVFPAERRGAYFGWVMSGFSLALVVGSPALALVSGLFGWRWAFATEALLQLVLVGAHVVVLPRLPRSGSGTHGVLSGYRLLFADRRASTLLAFNLAERVSYATVTIYFASFLMLAYGLSTAAVAPLLPFVAVGGLIGTWLGGRLSDRLSPPALLIACQAAAAVVGLPLMAVSPSLTLSVALGAVFGVFNAGSRAPVMALAAQVTTQARGTMMGLMAMTNHAGLVLGATIGGAVISFGGYPALTVLCAAGALVATVCGAWFRRHWKG